MAGEDLGVEAELPDAAGRVWPLLQVIVLTWLLTMVGLLLFVVPGVVVGVLLAVSVPVQVIEGTGVAGALALLEAGRRPAGGAPSPMRSC